MRKMSQAAKSPSSFEIRSGDNSFAREVIGLDVKKITDQQFEELETAFDFGGVLFLRDQEIDPEDLVDFSKRFGEPEAHVRQEYALPGFPEIHVLSNIKDGEKTIGSAYAGDDWHLDLCFMKAPARMAVLYAIEIPHDDDGNVLGDTLFASGADAYDTLDPDLRDSLEGKKCLMQYNRRQEMKRLERI
ncbi:MAG TPA: taurine dioxygenase, partial [Rhodospirillaceae bacterium]|nr:taurine dioxygenase [Rhodospirillaceae bacterium]